MNSEKRHFISSHGGHENTEPTVKSAFALVNLGNATVGKKCTVTLPHKSFAYPLVCNINLMSV